MSSCQLTELKCSGNVDERWPQQTPSGQKVGRQAQSGLLCANRDEDRYARGVGMGGRLLLAVL